MNRGRIDAWLDRNMPMLDHLGGDHVVRLGDTAGNNAQSVIDALGVERAWIDSTGAAMLHGVHGHLAAVAVDRLIVPLAHGVLRAPLHADDTRMDFGDLTHSLPVDTFVMLYRDNGITEYVLTDEPTVTMFMPGLPWVPMRSRTITRDIIRDIAGTGALEWATGTPYMVFGIAGEPWIEISSVNDVRLDVFVQGESTCSTRNPIHIGKMVNHFQVVDEGAVGMFVGYEDTTHWHWDQVTGLWVKAHQLIVQAAADQSVDLQEWQDEDGVVVASVDVEGNAAVQGLNVGAVAEHADNAAAVTAGLAVGAVYRTGDLLKVVHT